MFQNTIDELKNILENSRYTVALCGSEMMEEGGFIGVKKPDKAYEIEKKYKVSPEEIFTSAFYNTRPDQFFEFYKTEMLHSSPSPTESGKALAAMERAGKLQCIITANIYELNQKSGCTNVINLHGSIYRNQCPRCKKEYSMEYVRDSKKVPLCENCGAVVRPLVSLFGEMMDSQIMTKTVTEIEKADTLLVLGTTLESEVFSHYIKYFEGTKLVVIHQKKNHLDYKADLVIYDYPKHVLSELGY